MAFIDIHGHYAWNIDDGMPSYEDARKALELARENRISAIVATPHVTPGVHTKDDIHDFIQRIDDLRMLATEYNIDILDGCELFLNHDYQKALDQNLFIPIENTQYVLVEFDVRKEIGNEQEIEERFIATVACKAAVKAHMALTKEEVDSLMDKLLELPNPFTCPHGRPTAIKMTKYDIERKFARK